jgi:FRG domain.
MSNLEKTMASGNEFIVDDSNNPIGQYISFVKGIYELEIKKAEEKAKEKAKETNIIPKTKHLFFRGQADVSWSLTPKVLREKNYNEKELVLDFYHYGPLHSFNYDLDNDRLSLLTDMQHYEVPTRLLDWSLSPLSSLYFAVESPRDKINKKKEIIKKIDINHKIGCLGIDIKIGKIKVINSEKDAVVYALNPWVFNNQVLNNNYKGYNSHPKIQDSYLLARALLSTYKDFAYIKKFVYDKYGFRIIRKDIQEPFALVSNFTNSRMQHQRGVFTIHGIDKVDLRNEDYFKDNAYKIIIRADVKHKIYDQLNWLYINEYTQYPDIKGIKEIVRNRQGFFNI